MGNWFQMTTIAIACATSIYALLFRRLSGREGARGNVDVARIERSNTQRQKHYKVQGGYDRRSLAAFHGSTSLGQKSDLMHRSKETSYGGRLSRRSEKPASPSLLQICYVVVPRPPIKSVLVLVPRASAPISVPIPRHPTEVGAITAQISNGLYIRSRHGAGACEMCW
jgi:hypothetical protein